MESGHASEGDERAPAALPPGDAGQMGGANKATGVPHIKAPAEPRAKSPAEPAKRAAWDDAEELTGPTDGRRRARLAVRVRPTLGASFEVCLRPEATLGDLRDAVADATGVGSGAQLLGHAGVSAEQWRSDDSKLVEVLPVGSQPQTVSLAVRASTGLSGSVEAISIAEAIRDGVTVVVHAECDSAESGDALSFCGDSSDASGESSSGDPETSDTSESCAEAPQSPLLDMVDTIDGLSLADAPRPPPPEPKTRLVTDAPGPGSCAHCGARCRPALRFVCRCGGTFCGAHRYHDAHGCPAADVEKERALLAAANPRVVRPQLDVL